MYSGPYETNKPQTSQSMMNYNQLNRSKPYHAAFPVNPHSAYPHAMSPYKPLPKSLPPKGPKPMHPHIKTTTRPRSNNSAASGNSPHPRSMTVGIQQAVEIPCKRKPQQILMSQRSAPLPTHKTRTNHKQMAPKTQHRTMQQRVWEVHIQNEPYTHNHNGITPTNSTTNTGPVPVATLSNNSAASTQNVRQCPLGYMGCNGYYNGYNLNDHYDEYQKQHLDLVIAYFENKMKHIQHDYTRKIKEINIANVNKIEELKHINAKQIQGLQEENEQLKSQMDELMERVNDIKISTRKTTTGSERKHTVHSRIPQRKIATESKIPATFKEFQKVRTMTEDVVSSDDSDLDIEIDEEHSQ